MKTAFRQETVLVLLLMVLALLFAMYWSLRYSGLSNESDTIVLSLGAEGVSHEGTLTPSQSAYVNGYGYPAALATISQITGVTIGDLQRLGGYWLPVIALVAYITYRKLIQSPVVAALGVLFLFMQPDFLFYVMRSSHERSTWTLGLLVIWLWANIYTGSLRKVRVIGVPLIYLLIWAMIANNAYLASTIMVTYTIALLAFSILWWLKIIPPSLFETRQNAGNWMFFIPLISVVLIFVSTFYVYKPSLGYYITLKSITDRLAVMFLAAEPSSDPYTYTRSAWRSTTVYLALTSVQWVILLASFAAWVRDGLAFIRRRENFPLGRLALWLLYLGFAVQVSAAMVIDFSGVLASNLQVRLFPPFALVSSLLAATWLTKLRQPKSGYGKVHVAATVIGAFAVLMMLLKITNDPLVSNNWLFYRLSELKASVWVDNYIHDRVVWLDIISLQQDLLMEARGYDGHPSNDYRYGKVSDDLTHVLMTDLTVYQAQRSGVPLPETSAANRVYDNGDAQFYYLRSLKLLQE